MGGVAGAAVGVVISFLFQKRVQKSGQPLKFSPGQGIKVGAGFFNFLRALFDIGR